MRLKDLPQHQNLLCSKRELFMKLNGFLAFRCIYQLFQHHRREQAYLVSYRPRDRRIIPTRYWLSAP
jgi:hypothetical protein